MSRLRLALLLILGAGAAQASTWSDLWWTRDQQGQRLLDDRKPAAAAQVFADARRRGYAELEAGHYAAAAKLLEPYRDADSQYNRGNALAHTGQLTRALDAYDAALAGDPGNRDVIKNRDLVKRALDQQRATKQQHMASNEPRNGSGGGGGQQPNSAEEPSGRAGSMQGEGSKGAAGGSGAKDTPGNGGQNRPGSTAPDRSSQQGESPGSQQTGTTHEAPGQGQEAGQTASKREPNQQSGGSQPGGFSPADPGTGRGSENSRAGPDGQTAVARAHPGRVGQTSGEDREKVRNEALSALKKQHAEVPGQSQHPKPRSEQALALDQWLRTIPEDSGELLQRKFMIEHLMKQRGNQP